MGFCTFGFVSIVQIPFTTYLKPTPQLIDLLKQSIELHPNQNFVLNHSCVTNSKGQTRFKIELNQSGQSHVSTQNGPGIEVSNIRLDDYCIDMGIDYVDFAKIDLEGHELPALQGWRNYLSAHSVKALYIEIIPENQARYGIPTNAPLSYLESFVMNSIYAKKKILDLLDRPFKYERPRWSYKTIAFPS